MKSFMTLYAANSFVRDERAADCLPLQRVLLFAASIAYFAAGAWNFVYLDGSLIILLSCVAAGALTLGMFAYVATGLPIAHIDALPIIAAVVFSAQTALGMAVEGSGIAQQFPLPFTIIALFVASLAPRLRSALIAISVTIVIGSASFLLVISDVPADFNPGVAFIAFMSGVTIAIILSWTLEQARRKSSVLHRELERRATSDDLTGVSNRAHINLLAQNEFARARRYKEPFSCLMIEIDGFETLKSSYGVHASDVVVQVLCGYCSVIMRHCDSLGRLGPHRFLALLPETEGAGALTLATRMCRDAAALKVQSGGIPIIFSTSIGAAELHPTDRWAGDMLRRTEQALEDAIERGGSNAVLAESPHALATLEEASA